jgi:prolyl oligopeptidase
MLAQHPKLFGACIAYFGFYDFLRSELHSNGQYSIPALGTVTNPEQYPVLRDSSPYHHIAKGTDYPATLLITSVNDPRVDPMHSRKMAAAMQTRTQSSKPILLLTVGNTGHFVVREEDTYGFLLNEIGALWKPPVQSLRLPGADGRSRRTRR